MLPKLLRTSCKAVDPEDHCHCSGILARTPITRITPITRSAGIWAPDHKLVPKTQLSAVPGAPTASTVSGKTEDKASKQTAAGSHRRYARVSLSATLGTTNDARKIGVILRPWQLKLMTWPSVT